jgi:hypothetical protein
MANVLRLGDRVRYRAYRKVPVEGRRRREPVMTDLVGEVRVLTSHLVLVLPEEYEAKRGHRAEPAYQDLVPYSSVLGPAN